MKKNNLREVRLIDLITYYYLTLLILIIIWLIFILNNIYSFIKINNNLILLLTIILTYIPLRNHLIGMILMYKAYAPINIRSNCRYMPSCSTYMIMSISKYGIILGITIGIKRISRCKVPYGGYDYPSLKSLFKRNIEYEFVNKENYRNGRK